MKEGWHPASAPTKATRRRDGSSALSSDSAKKHRAKVAHTAAVSVGKLVCARSSSMRLMSVAACASAALVFPETCLLRTLLMKSLVGKESRGMESTTLVISGFSSTRCGSAEKSEMSASPTSYALPPMALSFTEFARLVWNALAIFASTPRVRTFSKGTRKSPGAALTFSCRKSTRLVTTCGTFGGIADVGRSSKGVPNVHGWYVPWTETKKSLPPSSPVSYTHLRAHQTPEPRGLPLGG